MDKYPKLYAISAALLIVFSIAHTTNALAATVFRFHFQDIGPGAYMLFKVSNIDTGHWQTNKLFLKASTQTLIIHSLGGFPSGDSVRGCVSNISTGRTSCDTAIVRSGVDFFVSRR